MNYSLAVLFIVKNSVKKLAIAVPNPSPTHGKTKDDDVKHFDVFVPPNSVI